MLNLGKRSSNPFFNGTRPRQFFGELLNLIKEKKSKYTKKKYNPDWNKLKCVKS